MATPGSRTDDSRGRRAGRTRPPPPAGTRAGTRAAAPTLRRRHRPSTTGRPRPPPARSDDAINLGSTVLPILAKTYWKQGLAALVVVAVIVILIAIVRLADPSFRPLGLDL